MPGPTSSATGQSAPRAWAPSLVVKPFPAPHLRWEGSLGGREARPLLVRLPLASCSDGNVPQNHG